MLASVADRDYRNLINLYGAHRLWDTQVQVGWTSSSALGLLTQLFVVAYSYRKATIGSTRVARLAGM
jgi:hypothetical protein